MKEGKFAPKTIDTTQDIMGHNQNIDPLVSQVIAGDRDAFTVLYMEYFPIVKGVCLDIVRDPDTADDLAQNVFTKLPESIKFFKGESVFSTWLHRVAVNEALMHLRKVSARKEITTEREALMHLRKVSGRKKMAVRQEETAKDRLVGGLLDSATSRNMSDQAEDKATDIITIEKAIEKLPQKQKAVYLLSTEGYEAKEIAKKIGINTRAAKSQLFRARTKLRELLG